ncbi:hypothetical protein TNCV_1846591 [Trichonephila clavipes]|nr:hypothetical protein TNCV_1846591 [Trichonephila clavipes]
MWAIPITNRGVATTVSAISMIQGPQATGAPTCVTTVPLTGLSFLKKAPEEVLIRGPLRTCYASDNESNVPKILGEQLCIQLKKIVLDESRSFFRVHTGYFSNIPKCIKGEFIASWGCSQSSVVSSSQR